LFIRNFIHKDSEIHGIDVVFVDSSKPDLEMEAFFKRHLSGVTYIRGSVMEYSSLKNSKIQDAKACLILANRNASDPSEEDAANIMRATSIKNFDPNIRIIIQLLQYQNKTFLLNIPNWNWDKVEGDDVICISELKLGLMAQNCLAPGISTYMANLFTMRSFKGSVQNTWMDLYGYGACNEIYVENFSPAFVGLTFAQAAETCFSELGVLLVAIQDDSKPLSSVSINPTKMTITHDTTGFFIAQSPEEVRR
jgi:potassium large conductance calcium-activated channel subfamily M alpha protein 1